MMVLNCGVGEEENPLDGKEIKPVNSSCIFAGRTFAETEVPVLWSLM